MLTILVGIICLILGGVIVHYKFRVPKLEINKEILNQNNEASLKLTKIQESIKEKENQKDSINNQIDLIQNQINQLEENKQKIYQTQKEAIDIQLELDREKNKQKLENEVREIDGLVKTLYQDLEVKKAAAEVTASEIQSELDKLQSRRQAAIEAAIREQQLKEQQEFFKIKISTSDIEDIQLLSEIKNKLHQPDILSKLIWSSFYLKPTGTLVSNVIGTNKACGIYKITDIDNDAAVYIGQSVDVSERWKTHVKSALGATPATQNKLYPYMRDKGVHNFTFELLEQCERQDLNDREKYWITFYQSDKYGLNATKGNK